LRLSLFEHPDGVATDAGARVVYDLLGNEAHWGAVSVDDPAVVWELGGDGAGAALSVDLDLGGAPRWIVRCDRVDFPPGAVAHRHVHPGGGIRRLLFGSLHVDAPDHAQTVEPGGVWFEGPDFPVLATASAGEDTAFVRVLVLPAEWEGKRTIRYLDPADEAKPRLQRATVFFERRLET
jgi:hypothetical protein